MSWDYRQEVKVNGQRLVVVDGETLADRAEFESIELVSPSVEDVIFRQLEDVSRPSRNHVDSVIIEYDDPVSSWFVIKRRKVLIRACTTPRK